MSERRSVGRVGDLAARHVTLSPAVASATVEALRETHAMERLKENVRRAERRLDVELAIWDGSGLPETREVGRVQSARQVLAVAQRRLVEAETAAEVRRAERAAEALRERLRALRAPPDLQALVERHGSWQMITADAWAEFEAATVRWRERLIAGDFQREAMRMQRERQD